MVEIKNNHDVGQMTDDEVIGTFRTEGLWGLCTTVDLRDCNPATIRDAEKIREFTIELCDLIKMKRFGEPTIVHFGPTEKVAGYSLVQLIETSCITAHFANETNAAYIDIFSCREYPPKKAAEFCREFFEADRVKIKVAFRE